MKTYDAATIESTGAFLVGELERLDPTLYLPLFSVTWNRDILLREDVAISDEASSFTNTILAAVGGTKTTGKNWVNNKTGEIAGVSLKIKKTVLPMTVWGMRLAYSIIELAKAQAAGRPIDQQKLEAIKIKHNMDVDEMVYIGDDETGATGLLNNPGVAPASITTEWDDADITPKMILDDINGLLEQTWKASGYAACPTQLLLPPLKFSRLVDPVTTAGSKSILEYVAENSISNRVNGRPLEINPVKWLSGRGTAGKDRMVAYTKEQQFVRYPMVPLQRTPLSFRDLDQSCVYFGTLGELEFVYGETVGYADGL